MRRTFGRRGRSAKPNLTWSDVSTSFGFAAITATSSALLIQLQSPTNLSNLTSDPPEDLTVLRMVGWFNVSLTTGAGGAWTLALLVADVTWTPGATVSVDNDKRLLWQMPFRNFSSANTLRWDPPGLFQDGTTIFPDAGKPTFLDIAPRVKIEPGKALTLVAYEDATNGTLTVLSQSMRVLYKRSGRR